MTTEAAARAENLLDFFTASEMRDRAETLRIIETARTVKYAWHPWPADINNLGGDGFKYGIQHQWLRRHQLIALPVYRVAQFKTLAPGGFAIGGQAGGFASEGGIAIVGGMPARPAADYVQQRDQLPSESAQLLMAQYGEVGMTILESLTAQSEAEEQRAYTLFYAVMCQAVDGVAGIEVINEDLPGWLAESAPIALDRAIREGVRVGDLRLPKNDKFGASLVARFADRKLQPAAEDRALGLRMIAEMEDGIARAIDKAINPATGVLVESVKQIQGAAGNQPHQKRALDRLDQALMKEHPGFNVDPSLERTLELVRAAQDKPLPQSDATLDALREQNRLLAVQNERLFNLLEKGKKKTEQAA